MPAELESDGETVQTDVVEVAEPHLIAVDAAVDRPVRGGCQITTAGAAAGKREGSSAQASDSHPRPGRRSGSSRTTRRSGNPLWIRPAPGRSRGKRTGAGLSTRYARSPSMAPRRALTARTIQCLRRELDTDRLAIAHQRVSKHGERPKPVAPLTIGGPNRAVGKRGIEFARQRQNVVVGPGPDNDLGTWHRLAPRKPFLLARDLAPGIDECARPEHEIGVSEEGPHHPRRRRPRARKLDCRASDDSQYQDEQGGPSHTTHYTDRCHRAPDHGHRRRQHEPARRRDVTPSWWALADAAGTEADIATPRGRD